MADTTRNGPLTGYRILEIGHFVAAPFCSRLLGDLGAEIIKIEPIDGDPVRQWGEQIGGNSLWWSIHGRNKRSLTLNLKSPRAVKIVLDLCKKCDAVVENFRPGQLAKLGLADDVLRKARNNLVIAHLSGFGQDGPYRDRAAFGVIGEAIGGLRYLSNHAPGTTDLPPVRVGLSIGDSIAGLYAAFGIVSALLARQVHGKGDSIDVALTDSILSMTEGMLPEFGALGKVRQPTGSRIATAAPSSAYPTSDGKWILIAANSEPLFQRLANLMGRPDLIDDPKYAGNRLRVKNTVELDAIISTWTRQLEVDDLAARLEAADVPATVVYTAEECASDPQFRFRQMVREVDDPRLGTVLHTGVVPRFADNPGQIRRTGPAVGEDTNAILNELLGIDIEQVAELRAEGIV